MVKIEVRMSEPDWCIEEKLYELYGELLKVGKDIEFHIVHLSGGKDKC